jgi:hypothetical protein
MTRLAVVQFVAPLLLAMALSACGDEPHGRGGPLGPRGTALPPPDLVPSGSVQAPPARR